VTSLGDAIETGALGGRLWLYSNYHCNLSCGYCLTDSAPRAPRRALPAAQMIATAGEAAALGFTGVGVTGGEPFLMPHLPDTLAAMAAHLPVVVLTNGTLFTDKLLERIRPLAQLPVTLQLSLDSSDAATNDRNRAEGNHTDVVAAIGRLRALGLHVRIATTGVPSDDERERLCALHLSLGITDDDHVIRPIIRRGRGVSHDGAVPTSTDNLAPELTITTDGAFWSPFAPTVTGGRLDTDLLICRITSPLAHPTAHLMHLLGERPPGTDTVSGIP
jgi:MoaA/NifB/PqqE/SkfB family radical SAM enzyme